jgi:hypothetical protein
VSAPSADGRWVVRRRLSPLAGRDRLAGRWRRRTRGLASRTDVSGGLLDLGHLGDVPVIGIIAVIASLIGLVLLLALVIVPLLVAIAEIALVLLLAALSLPLRVLLRRPWLVEAHHPDGRALRWRVVGWRASTELRQQAQELLDAGVVPPDAERVERGPS